MAKTFKLFILLKLLKPKVENAILMRSVWDEKKKKKFCNSLRRIQNLNLIFKRMKTKWKLCKIKFSYLIEMKLKLFGLSQDIFIIPETCSNQHRNFIRPVKLFSFQHSSVCCSNTVTRRSLVWFKSQKCLWQNDGQEVSIKSIKSYFPFLCLCEWLYRDVTSGLIP